MPFSRPALADLINRAITDIQSRLPGQDATLRRSNLNVLSRVHAGVVHALYGYLGWLSQQMMYDTAESEYLDRWAAIWGVNRIPAQFATGNVTFTGTSGVTVPAGTELQRPDGALFTTDADVTLSSMTGTVSVTALEAGYAGNTANGTQLVLTTPIAGVNSTATASLLSNGVDIEGDESLRARLITRIQQPPQGGSKHDYVAWCLEVPGVTRAWAYPHSLGIGTVKILFVRDNDVSIIPDVTEVAAVQAYIDERRPVTAQVSVFQPVAAPLNFTLSVVPSTLAVKAAVIDELTDLIARESVPGGVLYISHIRAAISAAVGETNYDLISPSVDVALAAGQLTIMGTVTWL